MPKAKTAPAATALIDRPTWPPADRPVPRPADRPAPPPVERPQDMAAALARVAHTDDVVEYTLRCVLALAPNLSEAIVQAADRRARDLFGRSTAYVAARAGEGRSARNDAIRAAYRAGERVPFLARRWQLSERMVWRIVTQSDQDGAQH